MRPDEDGAAGRVVFSVSGGVAGRGREVAVGRTDSDLEREGGGGAFLFAFLAVGGAGAGLFFCDFISEMYVFGM